MHWIHCQLGKLWHVHCRCMTINNGEWWFIYASDVQCWRAVLVMNNDRTVHLLIDYKPQLESHKLKKEKEMHWIQIGEIHFGAVRVNTEWWFIYASDVHCWWAVLVMNNGRIVHLLIDYKPLLETHKIQKDTKMPWMHTTNCWFYFYSVHFECNEGK